MGIRYSLTLLGTFLRLFVNVSFCVKSTDIDDVLMAFGDSSQSFIVLPPLLDLTKNRELFSKLAFPAIFWCNV